MKKVFSIMICMILSLSMSACDSKAKPLQSKESYTIGNQIEMQLKGIVIDQQVNPTNMNHEYQYWYTDEKGYRLVDVQFYVENHSDQTQELSDFYDAELQIDDNSVKQDVCMELEHYTKIEKETTLAANTKTILHQFFYLKEKDLKKDLTAVFTLDDEDYTLSIKQMKPKVMELKNEQLKKIDDISLTIQKATVASVLTPMIPSESSTYYFAEGDYEYVGIYAMIENNGKEPLVLEHDFYVTFEVNHEIYDAWTTMLSPQANDFTQETQIAKNDSRFVLFFCEIPLSNETKTYDINLMINGMPYHYRYEHTEIK